MFPYDIIFVGGGLASCLAAMAAIHRNAELRILILEKGERLCGDHTWCFHGSDVIASDGVWDWLRELTTATWKSHKVKFPDLAVDMTNGNYHMIRSADLDLKVRSHKNLTVLLGRDVSEVCETVRCKDGASYSASVILDSRPLGGDSSLPCGYQKFVGLEFSTSRQHGMTAPMLMDASVAQLDGFRFFYCMPTSSDRILIEDTRYSNTSAIDIEEFESEIRAYARANNLDCEGVVYREAASLPIPLSFDRRFACDKHAIGYRGGLFNPTTGYSCGEAVKFADWLSMRFRGLQSSFDANGFYAALSKYRSRVHSRFSFYLNLNRMMFGASLPEKRLRIMRRFYGLNEKTIARFYSGHLSVFDKVKILSGRPPVPVTSAIRSLFFPKQALEAVTNTKGMI